MLDGPYHYTRETLLLLRSLRASLDDNSIQRIRQLACSRRGCRGGSSNRRCIRYSHTDSTSDQFSIPVITVRRSADRDSNNHCLYHGRRESLPAQLKTLRRLHQHNESEHFRFGVFNARSINNKYISISEWIVDEKQHRCNR